MAKTLTNLRALFLNKINQESDNHDFGTGTDYTRIDIFLNEAYREIMKITGVGQFRESLTLTVSDAEYIIGTDILTTVNNPRILRIVDYKDYPLTKLTEAEFSLYSTSDSGNPTLWAMIHTYSGSPTAMVRTVNFYPKPNSAEVLYLICEILPAELSATTDVPIWDEVFGLHNIIASVAAAKALMSIGDARFVNYEVAQDKDVREMKLLVAVERAGDNREPGPTLKRNAPSNMPFHRNGVIDYP